MFWVPVALAIANSGTESSGTNLGGLIGMMIVFTIFCVAIYNVERSHKR